MTDRHPIHGLGGYVRQFFSNWREYDAPVERKVWLTLRNRARAFSPPFRGCCGHHGEPGC
jgi:hypothetical protein